MNYARIYEMFIEDRKLEIHDRFSYVEVHHIVPRSMGGSNEKTNLIALTPEDHFFAHLLLAKAHGGNQWLALSSMLNRGMKTKEIRYREFANKRKGFGLVRRLLAKNLTGLNNHQTDNNIYTIRHIDGSELTGYRFELSEKTGIPLRNLGRLIRDKEGRTKSLKGWYYPQNNPNGDVGPSNSPNYKLYNAVGDTWEGTAKEFFKAFKKRIPSKNASACGWFRDKQKAENSESSKKKLQNYTFINDKTKVKYKGSVPEFAKHLGLNHAGPIYKVVNGDSVFGKIKGYRVEGIDAKRTKKKAT